MERVRLCCGVTKSEDMEPGMFASPQGMLVGDARKRRQSEGALHLDILEGDLSQQRVSGDGEVRSQVVKRKGEANGENSSPHTTSNPRLRQPL